MAKPDEYTAEVDDLEDLDEELDDEDLAEDLHADLDDEDLHVDLTDGLEDEELDDDAGVEAGLDEDLVDGETADEEEEEEDDDEVAELDEDEEEEEEALDVLLARDVGLNDDLARLDDESRDGMGNSDAPISAGEFTCRSCFLVKRRPQLADEERMVCLDCV